MIARAQAGGSRARVLIGAAAVLAVVLPGAACGDDSADGGDTTAKPASTTTAEGADSTSSTSTTAGGEAAEPYPDSELPGESFDLGPEAGEVLAVVGVAHDDVLNVRAKPGAEEEILAELTPTDADLVATGRARLLPSSIWYEVDADGATGWVSSQFVAHLGDNSDTTSEITAAEGGIPSAPTMVELGEVVAAAVVEPVDGGEGMTRTVLVVDETVGDLGEVTYDVVGFPDDSVYGERLHVFGSPGDSGGYTLKSVESTLLCRRGVSDGLCV